MKIYVCPCVDKEKSMAALPSVIAALRDSGIIPVLDEQISGLYSDERAEYTGSDEALSSCEMLLTVGGDGMILKWGRLAAVAGKPLVGINTGRLGFMTALDADETEKLSALADGSFTVSRRMMLSAELVRKGEKSGASALNDIVLFKEAISKLPEFTVRVNGVTVTRIRADGLILSTPTGSTAYALSAGGPIIEPTVECIQLTALCAHTLLNRPMIFSGSDILSISCGMYEGSRVNMSIDGGTAIEIGGDDELIVKKSDIALQLVEIGGKSFYSTVSEKLMTPLK